TDIYTISLHDALPIFKALNIFDLYAKRTMMNRYHEMQIGEFKEKLDIVGYKASFSMSYGDNSEGYFMKVVRGRGINDECEFEGRSEEHTSELQSRENL